MPLQKRKKVKTIIAYADVGSHGGIFEFIGGPTGEAYPHLLHIYTVQHDKSLVPVKITEHTRPTNQSKKR